MATKGYILRLGLEPLLPLTDATPRSKREQQAMDLFIKKMDDLREYIRGQLKWSRALQEEQTNKYRLPVPEFRVDNKVILDARNLKTSRPSKLLDYKNISLYKIVRVINNIAYKIALPETLKGVYPVFHPQLLYLDDNNPLPGQYEPSPPPINVDEEGEDYEAEEILDSRINKRRNNPLIGKKGCLVYKVKYKGYEGVQIQ